MATEYTPTQENIDTAWPSSEDRFEYPPVKEKIIVHFETSQNFKRDNGDCYPFIRLTAIPDRFHEAVTQLSRGSTCPVIESHRNTFYSHDVYRWLRAIGITLYTTFFSFKSTSYETRVFEVWFGWSYKNQQLSAAFQT